MSPTHGYCPSCNEESALDRNRACLWCGTATTTHRVKGRYKRRSDTFLTDDHIRTLHGLHFDGGMSIRDLGKRIWREAGYASWVSAARAIARGFHRLHLPIKHRDYPQPREDQRCRWEGGICNAFRLEGESFCWSHHPENRDQVQRNAQVATAARLEAVA